MQLTLPMRPLISSFLTAVLLSGCSLFQVQSENAETLIEKSSQQKIFYAPYDLVWKAAHAAIRYTIANENQDYGVIETDYIKAVDGWLPPDQNKPQYKSARYKIYVSFAKGKTNGKDSTRVTIEKKIEVFKDFISEKTVVPSDGLEEQSIFYRIERELIIDKALKKAASVSE